MKTFPLEFAEGGAFEQGLTIPPKQTPSRVAGIGILARSLYSDKDLRAMEPFAIYKSFQDYEKILREVFKINPKKKR